MIRVYLDWKLIETNKYLFLKNTQDIDCIIRRYLKHKLITLIQKDWESIREPSLYDLERMWYSLKSY